MRPLQQLIKQTFALFIVVIATLNSYGQANTGDGMVTIPSGSYVPLYGNDTMPVQVETFAIDQYQVTNADFREFVNARKEWQKDNIKPLFADTNLDRNLFCAGGAVGVTDSKNYVAFMRYPFRSSLKANYTVANLGFRCAKDIEK